MSDTKQANYSETMGDPRDQEYTNERAVYRIDDGEQHWYVATDMAQALRAHVGIMGPAEEYEVTIRRLPPEDVVILHLESEADAENFPPHFERYRAGGSVLTNRIRAFAAAWASHLEAGEMVCSSALP